MATTVASISAYRVTTFGGPNGNGGVAAVITLTITSGRDIGSAYLRFYLDGSSMPANRRVGRPGDYGLDFDLSYRYGQLGDVMDVLRNEKPLNFVFDDGTLGGYVTTSNEPVGEGEGS